jgi:hypothetical protein
MRASSQPPQLDMATPRFIDLPDDAPPYRFTFEMDLSGITLDGVPDARRRDLPNVLFGVDRFDRTKAAKLYVFLKHLFLNLGYGKEEDVSDGKHRSNLQVRAKPARIL